MQDLTLDRYRNDAQVRAEVKSAAQRERARVLKRFLEQAAQSLLGDRSAAARVQPCQAC
jgi:hypothetical protein